MKKICLKGEQSSLIFSILVPAPLPYVEGGGGTECMKIMHSQQGDGFVSIIL